MNPSSLSMQNTISDEQRGERDTHLHGRRLILARIVWGVLATFELGMFAVSLPGFVTQLGIACTSSCMSQQLSAEAVKTLQHTGLSLGDYVAFSLAVTLTSVLTPALSPHCWSGADPATGWHCWSLLCF